MKHTIKHQTIGRSLAISMYSVKRSFSALSSFILLISLTPVLSAQENKEIPTVERVRNLNNNLLRLHGCDDPVHNGLENRREARNIGLLDLVVNGHICIVAEAEAFPALLRCACPATTGSAGSSRVRRHRQEMPVPHTRTIIL